MYNVSRDDLLREYFSDFMTLTFPEAGDMTLFMCAFHLKFLANVKPRDVYEEKAFHKVSIN